ncbi:unnamed protein product [Vitrella brassicaformis CCMP3155]|uniref:Uncharacterized protein n=3 Tax=Vitrella brassicaformis TaxID=1169539 RepID=A0A0G4FDM4_VITBC|nr:unnamed protein product [Vitrella brassicaformis CCMP3155]|eukprot:CEM11288.1 unnamed protein product [Vitrella brassicaformis CCMP3155]
MLHIALSSQRSAQMDVEERAGGHIVSHVLTFLRDSEDRQRQLDGIKWLHANMSHPDGRAAHLPTVHGAFPGTHHAVAMALLRRCTDFDDPEVQYEATEALHDLISGMDLAAVPHLIKEVISHCGFLLSWFRRNAGSPWRDVERHLDAPPGAAWQSGTITMLLFTLQRLTAWQNAPGHLDSLLKLGRASPVGQVVELMEHKSREVAEAAVMTAMGLFAGSTNGPVLTVTEQAAEVARQMVAAEVVPVLHRLLLSEDVTYHSRAMLLIGWCAMASRAATMQIVDREMVKTATELMSTKSPKNGPTIFWRDTMRFHAITGWVLHIMMHRADEIPATHTVEHSGVEHMCMVLHYLSAFPNGRVIPLPELLAIRPRLHEMLRTLNDLLNPPPPPHWWPSKWDTRNFRVKTVVMLDVCKLPIERIQYDADKWVADEARAVLRSAARDNPRPSPRPLTLSDPPRQRVEPVETCPAGATGGSMFDDEGRFRLPSSLRHPRDEMRLPRMTGVAFLVFLGLVALHVFCFPAIWRVRTMVTDRIIEAQKRRSERAAAQLLAEVERQKNRTKAKANSRAERAGKCQMATAVHQQEPSGGHGHDDQQREEGEESEDNAENPSVGARVAIPVYSPRPAAEQDDETAGVWTPVSRGRLKVRKLPLPQTPAVTFQPPQAPEAPQPAPPTPTPASTSSSSIADCPPVSSTTASDRAASTVTTPDLPSVTSAQRSCGKTILLDQLRAAVGEAIAKKQSLSARYGGLCQSRDRAIDRARELSVAIDKLRQTTHNLSRGAFLALATAAEVRDFDARAAAEHDRLDKLYDQAIDTEKRISSPSPLPSSPQRRNEDTWQADLASTASAGSSAGLQQPQGEGTPGGGGGVVAAADGAGDGRGDVGRALKSLTERQLREMLRGLNSEVDRLGSQINGVSVECVAAEAALQPLLREHHSLRTQAETGLTEGRLTSLTTPAAISAFKREIKQAQQDLRDLSREASRLEARLELQERENPGSAIGSCVACRDDTRPPVITFFPCKQQCLCEGCWRQWKDRHDRAREEKARLERLHKPVPEDVRRYSSLRCPACGMDAVHADYLGDIRVTRE